MSKKIWEMQEWEAIAVFTILLFFFLWMGTFIFYLVQFVVFFTKNICNI